MRNIGIAVLVAGCVMICGCGRAEKVDTSKGAEAYRHAKSYAMAQVLVAGVLYMDEHEGNWPDSLEEARKYLKDPTIDLQAYEYHKPPAKLGPQETSETVVLREKLTEFGGGVLAGFADGHVLYCPTLSYGDCDWGGGGAESDSNTVTDVNSPAHSSTLISEINQIANNLPDRPNPDGNEEQWDDWRGVDYEARTKRIAIIEELERENLSPKAMEPYIRIKMQDIRTCFYYTRLGEANRFEGKIYRMMDANSPLEKMLSTELFWSLNIHHVNTHLMHLSETDMQQIADFELSRKEQPEAGRLLAEAIRLGGLSRDAAMQWSTWILDNTHPESEGCKWVTANRLMKSSLGNTFSFTGRDMNGKEVNSEQFKGKVVLLDFWAFWCGHCLAEMPDLKKVKQEYHDQGLTIIGVFNDYRVDELREYAHKHAMDWPQLVEPTATKSEFMHPLARKYGLTGLPCYMLIDRGGKLVSTGMRVEEMKPKLVELLEHK